MILSGILNSRTTLLASVLFLFTQTWDRAWAEFSLRVRTANGEVLIGQVESLSADSGLQLAVDGGKKQTPWADLIDIRRLTDSPTQSGEGWIQPPGKDGVAVILSDGDRLAGRIGERPGDDLTLESEVWGSITLPWERVAELLLPPSALPAYAESLRWFRRKSEPSEDRVLLTNGDVVKGFITSLTRTELRLESGGEESVIPLRLVVAARLVFPQSELPREQRAIVTMSDGQKKTVAKLDWNENLIRIPSETRGAIQLPADSISAIEFRGGRWAPLSTRSPVRHEHVPMLSVEWAFLTDRNVVGEPLRVDGVVYSSGLGVHSKSILTYDLEGGHREFVSAFGMDDSSGDLADVTVLVRVDGQQRFERTGVRWGVLHGPIRVDVAGARTLELIVDFGKNGDIQDRFNWIEPGLVK